MEYFESNDIRKTIYDLRPLDELIRPRTNQFPKKDAEYTVSWINHKVFKILKCALLMFSVTTSYPKQSGIAEQNV